MNSPLNWKIFAGLTLTAWICIAMYAPYYWGETLVQQQQEMQKVEQSRTEREHREQHAANARNGKG